jgi:hypothetical protein
MRGRGHLHRLTVFIRHENVLRLLEFLGYRQEEVVEESQRAASRGSGTIHKMSNSL